MIAIDTNVLLRYLLTDDKVQSKKAAVTITGGGQVLVTDVVLAETIWTLKGKKYNLDKEGVISVINALFEEPNLCFEDGQTVWRALGDYRKAKSVKGKQADFPDSLIVNKASYVAQSLNVLLDGAYTFDVAAQELPGTKKP